MQNTRLSYTVSRSMSQFNVMGLTFEVGVCYISPEPFESVSLNFTQVFLSVRRCVEAMTQLPRLQKVKVTFQGHGIFTLQFSVWSHRLSSLNVVFFTQMLPSVRRCAEPMIQLRTVYVKLIPKDNGINPSILCLLHIFRAL